MNGKQYKNVIDWTLQHDVSLKTADSLTVAKAILKNMGIPVPYGDMKKVNSVFRTNRYMEWHPLKLKEAQIAANNGLAVIGVNRERIAIVSPVLNENNEIKVENTAVMTLSEKTTAYEISGLKFYSYGKLNDL